MGLEINRLPEKKEEMETELKKVAEEYNLKPVYLKEIVRYLSQGLNQKEIAEKTGVSRNTVRRYEKKLKEELNSQEITKIVLIASLLFGGAYILQKLF